MKLTTTICTAWFLIAGAGMLVAQSGAQAEKLLASARHKEVMEGDLKGAIEQYRKIAAQFAKQPEVAARALYQLGQCQEKLGQAEARSSYERIVREYGGAQEYAAAARVRLGALHGGPAGGAVQARLIWDNPIGGWGTASADGRHLSFVNWPTFGVGIRDISTGDTHVIPNSTLFGRGKGESGGTAISPDAKRVAFAYYQHNQPTSESGYDQLHVFNADGSGHKILLAGKDLDYIAPYSWSPDAKWIAALVVDRSQRNRLALIPSAGGDPRYLPIPTKQGIQSILFSPDGKWLAYSASAVRGANPALYLISAEAASDTESKLADNAHAMGWSPNSSGVLFSRDRSRKYELYLQPVTAGKPSGEPTLIHTNSDIGIDSLGVSAQGTLLYGIGNRRADATLYPFDGDLSNLGNPALKLPVTDGVSWLLGGGTMRFSPDGKRFLAVGTSSRELIIHSLVSDSHQTITPRLKRFTRAEWAPDGASILLMGMNQEGQHGILRLDPSSGATTFLTALPETTWSFVPSPDGRTIYYGKPDQVIARTLATGEDKQVWNGDGRGNFQLLISRNGKTLVVRASAYLGIVDLITGQVRQLYDQRQANEKDGVVWASTFSPDETKVLVIHRAGSMEMMEFGVYPVDGSTPSRFPAPKEFRGLHVSPDGKLLGTTVLTRHNQIWALENFLPASSLAKK